MSLRDFKLTRSRENYCIEIIETYFSSGINLHKYRLSLYTLVRQTVLLMNEVLL